MKIAIDARWIFRDISGIGAYTRELIRHLARLEKGGKYLLLFDNPEVMERTLTETEIGRHPRFSVHLLPYGVFSIKNQFLLPGWLKRNGVDIFHSPNYMIPLFAFPRNHTGRVRCVVTIHDVIPMIFPQAAPRSRKARLYLVYQRLMVEIGRRADAIITDSQASRQDVIRHLGIPESTADKVLPIYCGVSDLFRQTSDTQRPTAKDKSLLYVGRMDPYKNLAVLIRALAEARRQANFPIRLVIAGSPDPRYPETRRLARELGVEDAIRWTGYLPDAELLELYRTSDLLVHPSRYEGFGLQIVEAMASGTPVICGSGGALPEVAGAAAIVLDSDDIQGFTANILKVLSDPVLGMELAQRGRQQAEKFTWSRTAEQTYSVYQRIMAQPHLSEP